MIYIDQLISNGDESPSINSSGTITIVGHSVFLLFKMAHEMAAVI